MSNSKFASLALALLPGIAQAQTQIPSLFQTERTFATSPLVGCIPVYQPLSSPPWRKLCNTDNFATAFGYSTRPVYNTTGNRVQGGPTNPTGTSSLTGVMAGISGNPPNGANQATIITPTVTGNYIIDIVGWAQTSVAVDGGSVQLRFGTGTPPLNGDALAGTAFGVAKSWSLSATGKRQPWHIKTYLTGLTLGTAYWIDISQAAVIGGTASVFGITTTAVER